MFNYNLRQNIWNKLNKSSKAGQDYICILFDCCCQSLIFGRDTGCQATAPSKFYIFLISPNFLRSLVLSCSTICEATRITNLLYQISNFVLLDANRTCTNSLQRSSLISSELQVFNTPLKYLDFPRLTLVKNEEKKFSNENDLLGSHQRKCL